MDQKKRTEFERELTALLNKHGIDADVGTPDHLLAKHITDCIGSVKWLITHHKCYQTPNPVHVPTDVGVERDLGG